MPVITTLGIAASTPLRRVLNAFLRMLVLRAKKLERAVVHRRALQALARFDDRMLADIGLNRSDVRDAYAGSLWEDPTALLRARALERRLARHGITYGLTPETALAPPLAPKVDAAAVSQARVTFCHSG